VAFFRAGFGLALKLKWEAESWIKTSWFHGQGLDIEFWGDEWGGILAGLLKRRPRFYTGLSEGSEYRNFERLSEVDECWGVLDRLRALDGLLGRLAGLYSSNGSRICFADLTFHPLPFNFWARQTLGLSPSFSRIPLEQTQRLFRELRASSQRPPYRMPEAQEAFVNCLMSHASDFDPRMITCLTEVLTKLWEEFHREYEWVSLDQLDWRYSRFLSIIP
jgi:hypothetical protein